jgi:hypothetical protein
LRDDVIAAKERVQRALAEVGPELSGVLIDVCCEVKGLEDAEKSKGWAKARRQGRAADRARPACQTLRVRDG